jgi:ribonuclease G
VDDIERDLNFIFQSRPSAKITIVAHPYIHAFLKMGWYSKQLQWSFRHMKWIKIAPSNEQHISGYQFFDENNDQIRLNS